MRSPIESISAAAGAADSELDAAHSGNHPIDSVRPGLVMCGKYRLISEIGRGGMGAVWKAEHLAWQAPVAIKVMTRDVTGHSEALARFEREVQLAAGLRSPHVVQVLDHGIDAATQTPFIAMELLEGESLARRIKRAGPLSPGETFHIVSQLVRALSRAHTAGIVHRDLKPDNVFLVRNEEETIAKVLDFGVAKWTTPSLPRGGLTRPGSVLGTPFYMSPEQIQGSREIDHRADLWSLAAIACECLTGRRPFEADDFAQLAVLLLTSNGRPLPSNLGPVPPGFDAWFARATAPDIRRRFQTAREMAQTLAPLCGAAASSSPPDSFPALEEGAPSPESPSMAPVSHTASLLLLPGRLWRQPLARFTLSLLVGLGLAGSGVAWWYSSASAGAQGAGSSARAPAPRAAASGVAVTHRALEAAPPPSLSPSPSPPSEPEPGVRVVREPAPQEPKQANESSVRVEARRAGVEVDRESAAAQKRPATRRRAAPPRPRAKTKRAPPRPRRPSAPPAARASPSAPPASSGSGAPEASPSGLDVNGRRIRTSL